MDTDGYRRKAGTTIWRRVLIHPQKKKRKENKNNVMIKGFMASGYEKKFNDGVNKTTVQLENFCDDV